MVIGEMSVADTDNQSNSTSSLALSIGGINSASFGLGSVLSANSSIVTFGASIRQITEAVDNMFRPQRIMLEVLQSWAKQQREMFEGLAAISTRVFPQFPATTLRTTAVKEATAVLEGEIVEPKTIDVTYQPEILVSAFGIGVTADGRFYDKIEDRDLAPLNTGSTSGRYLMLLISSKYNYVTDDKLDRAMNSAGYHGGRRQLRQDLRKLLKRHDLDIETRRVTNRGTTLIGFKRIYS